MIIKRMKEKRRGLVHVLKVIKNDCLCGYLFTFRFSYTSPFGVFLSSDCYNNAFIESERNNTY